MARRLITTLAFILVIASTANAQVAVWPEGESRVAKWRAFNAAGLGINPIIFGDILKIYRVIPITKGKSFLTRDANFRFGGVTTLSPLLMKFGPMIGISPLRLCDFDFYWNQYIDPIHIKFESTDDSYDQHILNQKDVSLFWGQNFLFSTTLKMGYGPVVFLDMFDLEYLWMQDVWFSIEWMTVMDDGWHFTNRLFGFYEFAPGWRVGSMWEHFFVYNSGYKRHMLHFGIFAQEKLPLSMSLLVLTGYHIENPDFVGLRFWGAVLKEWDL